METRVEQVQSHDRDVSTSQLVRRALDEAKLLARAELLYAKQELRDDLMRARSAGIFFGVALTLAICGLSALCVALAAALPLPLLASTAVVGGGLLIIGGAFAAIGYKQVPRKVLARTQARLRADLTFAKETIS